MVVNSDVSLRRTGDWVSGLDALEDKLLTEDASCGEESRLPASIVPITADDRKPAAQKFIVPTTHGSSKLLTRERANCPKRCFKSGEFQMRTAPFRQVAQPA